MKMEGSLGLGSCGEIERIGEYSEEGGDVVVVVVDLVLFRERFGAGLVFMGDFGFDIFLLRYGAGRFREESSTKRRSDSIVDSTLAI